MKTRYLISSYRLDCFLSSAPMITPHDFLNDLKARSMNPEGKWIKHYATERKPSEIMNINITVRETKQTNKTEEIVSL